MATNKRRKKSKIQPVIICLNLAIAAVIILMIVLIYNSWQEDENKDNDPVASDTSETTENSTTPQTTTTAASITKVDTTTLASDNPDYVEVTTTTASTDNVTASGDYSESFYTDDLFIGDSITTGLSGYGFLDTKNVFAQVGLNPESALSSVESYGCSAVDMVKSMQPKRTYIMLGSNGMAFMDTEYMLSKTEELVSKIKDAAPTTIVVILSVPPVTQTYNTTEYAVMDSIGEYNKLLKNYAKSNGYHYIDIFSLLKDDTGYFSAEYAEADGMHFLGNTYKVMLSYIQKELS